MSRTSTYLNFPRETEAAFLFYRSVFGGDFIGGIRRFSDMPAFPGSSALSAEDAALVLHVELAITGGHLLMGTDAPETMGFSVQAGNQVHIMVEPDHRDDADRLLRCLSEGGIVVTPMTEMFWGSYFGACTDRFGIHWMVQTQGT